MQKERVSSRYQTKGHARIAGVEYDLLLRDLSITGCCLGSIKLTENIKLSEIYKIEIKPENEAKIGKFELLAECKWIRQKNKFNEIGFMVTDSPKGKHFQNYVDYIGYHSN